MGSDIAQKYKDCKPAVGVSGADRRRPIVFDGFFLCFGSCIYNPLHGARRAMAAARPLPLAEQRRAFLVNLFPTSDQLAQS